MQPDITSSESATLLNSGDPTTRETAEASHFLQCRNELKELTALLTRTVEQALTASELAAGLEHLRTLESDIGRLHRQVAVRDEKLNPEQEHDPDFRPESEATWPGFDDLQVPPHDSSSRIRGLWPGVAGISATVACIAVFWLVMVYRQADTSRTYRSIAPQASIIPVALVPVASRESSAKIAEPKIVKEDFRRGAEQLDAALERFRGESQESVLRRVHDENAANGVSVCSFVWNDGTPSLLFGDERDANLGAMMGRCAEAVERR